MHNIQACLHKSLNILIDLLILILYFLIATISYNKFGHSAVNILVLQPGLKDLDVVSIILVVFFCLLCEKYPL